MEQRNAGNVLYQINLIRRLQIKLALQGGPRDLTLQIGLIEYHLSYQINLIRSFPIKSALREGPRDLALRIGLIWY